MAKSISDVSEKAGLMIQTTECPVIIQTETNRIRGNIHLRENERIKDALNTSEEFIAMTAVKVFDQEGLSLLYETGFLALNRTKVVWVVEDSANIGVSEDKSGENQA